MKPLILTFLFLISQCCFSQEERRVGVNLTDLSPFGTTWIYTNALKQSSGWLVRNANDEEDQINNSSELTAQMAAAFDASGYPLEVPFQHDNPETQGKTLTVSCLVLNGQVAPYLYPSGDYLLIFEGTGEIEVLGDVDGGSQVFSTEGVHTLSVSSPTSLGLELRINFSLATNPVRNVQLIFPENFTNYQSVKFRSDFIELAQHFEVLRFMKPLRVEHNTVEDWGDRTLTGQFSYYLDVEDQVLLGMPYEDIIDFSNLVGIDPWICVPHRASDAYVGSLAALFAMDLDEDRQVFLEYSNETWNPSYPEKWQYIRDQGFEQDLATSENSELAEQEAIHRFATKRSLEVFQIFNNQFDDDDRVVKILGTQSDSFVADLVFEALEMPAVNPNDLRPDAIAIAAYIGVTLFDDLEVQGLSVCDHSAQDLLDSLRMRVDKEMIDFLSSYASLSDAAGIELFAYEGGQHVTEIGFQPMEPCAEDLVATMNRLPEIEDFFCDVFETWYEELGGELFMIFNLAERPDAFGAFGILESQFQEISTSSKWQGIERCALENEVLQIAKELEIVAYPNPVKNLLVVNLFSDALEQGKIVIHDLSGKKLYEQKVLNGSKQVTIDFSEFEVGTYHLTISDRSISYRSLIRKK